MAIALALRYVPVLTSVKLALPSAVVVSFALAHVLRRLPWLRSILR